MAHKLFAISSPDSAEGASPPRTYTDTALMLQDIWEFEGVSDPAAFASWLTSCNVGDTYVLRAGDLYCGVVRRERDYDPTTVDGYGFHAL